MSTFVPNFTTRLTIPGLVVGLLLLGCQPAPVPFPDQATRATADRAAMRLNDASPDAAELLRLQIAEAQVRSSAVAEPTLRREAAAAIAWNRALNTARRALREQYLQQTYQTRRWAELEPKTKAAVARAWHQLETPGLDRPETKRAQQASAQLNLARRLAAAGDLRAANAAAERALEHASAVEASWHGLHDRFRQPDLLRQWRSWAETTIAETRHRSGYALVVDKLKRRLEVYRGGRVIARFQVELGSRGLNRKLHAGDRATPEGRYRVTQVKLGGQTRYYKALLIDYPNGLDRERYHAARSRGQIPRGAGIGNLIEIHGDGGQGRDWTDGCIALTNDDMDRLMRYVRVSTPVVIVGTLGDRG